MTTHMLYMLAGVLFLWIVAWNLRLIRPRQAVLLTACYLFYSSWGFGFLSILIVSSLINFALGSLLRRRTSLTYLWLGIAFNVALLAFFKYLPPLLAKGSPGQSELVRHIIMPVGISFWTFQALSYLIDTYVGENEDVNPSLLEFCLYIAFWPTVLSGPICRLPNMLPQFRRQPSFSWDDISAGALYVVQGLFMKMYLSQLLASGWLAGQGVNAGFDRVSSGWGGVDVWFLGVGFGFQLFFDFAGYSLMAIGVARLFGIAVAGNFNRPFLSTTPAIFWTRWHMSLSFWIRDYVFRPLVFARRGRSWPYIVLVISMVLFGVWHGAKWTFAALGLYHGFVLVIHRLGQQVKPRFVAAVPPPLRTFAAWYATFLALSLGFILFRANDLTQALSMFRSVVSPTTYGRFVLPRNFYLLVGAIAVGYFLFVGAQSVLLSWMERYRRMMAGRAEEPESSWRVSVTDYPLVVGAFGDFLAAKLWWWFAPAIVSLTLFVGLAIHEANAVITVTPFIYTLF